MTFRSNIIDSTLLSKCQEPGELNTQRPLSPIVFDHFLLPPTLVINYYLIDLTLQFDSSLLRFTTNYGVHYLPIRPRTEIQMSNNL